MRVGLVCGDGVPASGLLTIFRNVVGLGVEMDLLDVPVPAELGYSWRPDKPAFFPHGPAEREPSALLGTARTAPPDLGDPGAAAAEWTAIRTSVAAADELDPAGRERLHRRIDRLAARYREYFLTWLRETRVDWTVAVNMTLSDAVPVTKALHAAARDRHRETRSGGVLFWDHDLFASCAVHDEGVRMYPDRPNEFTPLPEVGPGVRWAVVSDALAHETAAYPVRGLPRVVPNLLPRVPTEPLEPRHERFLADQDLDPGRPVLLNPVRVFRVKGVELSLELLAAARAAGADRGLPAPYLLVFGSLAEDPGYSEEVLRTARRLDLLPDVRFLDGVPLCSVRDPAGSWRLDEIDLLRIAAATGGGVVFTPNTGDVETVGLGPALAAVAGLPCASTAYAAFTPVYGEEFSFVPVDPGAEGMARSGAELVEAMRANRSGAPGMAAALRRNRQIVDRRFPVEPWARLLTELAANTADTTVPPRRGRGG
jgi:glycosyltransferase involved in cell wall biosynthesis